MANNTNCKNIENCSYCSSCYSCYYCSYCSYCSYCNYCSSCSSCDYCSYCYYCSYCSYCSYCNYCNYCSYCSYCNYCYFSKGLRMSERMLFCLDDGRTVNQGAGYQKNNQIFNTQVTEEEWNKVKSSLPEIKIQITKWVDKKDMTKEEKNNSSVYKEIGGYLKRYTYKEAWQNWWNDASKADKQAILDLPHFDGEIFTGITGITDFSVSEQTVNIGGTEYKVTPELTKALKDLKEI